MAGQGLHYLSGRRSVREFFLHLSEPPLIDSSIASIEVLYPSATILRLHWLVCVGSIAAVVFLVRRFLKTALGRQLWDRLKLRLPVFGPLASIIVYSRFCRTLGTFGRFWKSNARRSSATVARHD